jgi:3-oxosteroid 1-dehydrogenase
VTTSPQQGSDANEFDVIVLGTGAAGLSAAVTAGALGARVALLEKNDMVGGTSAWSGGHVWVPNNPRMLDIGIEDSAELAFDYIMSLSRGTMQEHLVRRYVEAGPQMVEFMDKHAGTEFYAVPFPDYHPERHGGQPVGGRTIECPLFAFADLGEWADKVTPSPYYAGHVTMSETPIGAAVPPVVPPEEIARRGLRNERGMGQGLVGRLLKACLDLGIEPRLSHRATELVWEDGKVRGVRATTPEGETTIRSRRGVILATGGFDFNEEYKQAFLKGPLTHSVAIETNTGDGLKMAMQARAMLGNMREAFWSTIAEVPTSVNSKGRALISGDRTRPRSIIVNKWGKRFGNEAANYNMFSGTFFHEDSYRYEYENLPCWLIFDNEYLRRYGTVSTPPAETAPEWLPASETLEGLAKQIDVDPEGLVETVERWNRNAAAGHDPDFHRGDSAFDRWWGDPNAKGTVEGTVGPLDRPPFYAVQVRVGAVGTKGGPRTDVDARVLDLDGEPIDGFYAAGNAMAGPLGSAYPGGGSTLGPAMIFGYLAGRHAADS